MGVRSQRSPASAEEHLRAFAAADAARAAGGMLVLMLTRRVKQKTSIKHVSKGARTFFSTWMGFHTLALEEGGAGRWGRGSGSDPVAMEVRY